MFALLGKGEGTGSTGALEGAGSANLLLPADGLQITSAEGDSPPQLTSLATSKHVTRHRCAECSSPVYAAMGKQRVVVPLSLFSPPLPEAWKPQHHLYYDRRVVDVPDDLPKFRTRFGGATWAGEPAEADAQAAPPAAPP